MSSIQTRAEARNETTAKAIMDAAVTLLAEFGFGAMSMRCLARQVGVLPGSLYFHVSCKQDLLADVVAMVLDARLDAWRKHARNLPNDELLKEFIKFLLNRQRTHAAHDSIVRFESRYIDPKLLPGIEHRHKTFAAQLETIIAVGQLAGRFDRSDPLVSAQCVLTLVDGAVHLRRSLPLLSEEALHVLVCQQVLRMLEIAPNG